MGGGKAPAAGHGGWWRNTGVKGWRRGTGRARWSVMAPVGSWCGSAAEGAGKCMAGTWAWSRPEGATMYRSETARSIISRQYGH